MKVAEKCRAYDDLYAPTVPGKHRCDRSIFNCIRLGALLQNLQATSTFLCSLGR